MHRRQHKRQHWLGYGNFKASIGASWCTGWGESGLSAVTIAQSQTPTAPRVHARTRPLHHPIRTEYRRDAHLLEKGQRQWPTPYPRWSGGSTQAVRQQARAAQIQALWIWWTQNTQKDAQCAHGARMVQATPPHCHAHLHVVEPTVWTHYFPSVFNAAPPVTMNTRVQMASGSHPTVSFSFLTLSFEFYIGEFRICHQMQLHPELLAL